MVLENKYKEKNLMDKTNNKRLLKVTRCIGEGLGTCKRCYELKGWNRIWYSFLFKIEGYNGCYCSDCVKAIQKENNK
jgi:hypothetical protein